MKFVNVWCQIKQILLIFTHMKLWVAIARHNFMWVKMFIVFIMFMLRHQLKQYMDKYFSNDFTWLNLHWLNASVILNQQTINSSSRFDFVDWPNGRGRGALAVHPFQPWIFRCHLHPLQAANCCRNSRFVVDEDDLQWLKRQRKLQCIGKPVSWKFSF